MGDRGFSRGQGGQLGTGRGGWEDGGVVILQRVRVV